MADQDFFQIADASRAFMLGGTAKNAAELCEGKLVVRNTDGTIQQAIATDKPHGFAFFRRVFTYRPTSKYADAGEQVSYAAGEVLALADKGFFVGATLPAVGDELYSAAGGLMATAGTNKIGKVIGTGDRPSAPSTTENFVVILCHFSGKDI
ncbi:MAG: hypothetical protein HY868_25500 [Chloroflexi bacterium]|nr:hypothetical protein [Chloroflexota bacterium]